MNIMNPVVEAYTDDCYRAQTQELATLRDECERKRVPIILKGTETALAVLLRLKKPARILEIGTAHGYSALFFAHVCEDCEIVTLEKSDDALREATENIAAFAMQERIRCMHGDALNLLATLADETESGARLPFDFAFVDAGKSHYREFWDKILPLMAPGGLIVCDNVLLKGTVADATYDPRRRHRTNIKRMREFTEYITAAEGAETYLLSVGDGLTVSIIEGNNVR